MAICMYMYRAVVDVYIGLHVCTNVCVDPMHRKK